MLQETVRKNIIDAVFLLLEYKKELDVSKALLGMFLSSINRQVFLDLFVQFLKKWSGMPYIGIRVWDETEFRSYESYIGFRREFWNQMEETGEEEASCKFRTKCVENGLLSAAVIPVHNRNQSIGAIYLADKNSGKLSPYVLDFLNSVGALVGELIAQCSIQDKKGQDPNPQAVINNPISPINNMHGEERIKGWGSPEDTPLKIRQLKMERVYRNKMDGPGSFQAKYTFLDILTSNAK